VGTDSSLAISEEVLKKCQPPSVPLFPP